jgi:hypothetical protein
MYLIDIHLKGEAVRFDLPCAASQVGATAATAVLVVGSSAGNQTYTQKVSLRPLTYLPAAS